MEDALREMLAAWGRGDWSAGPELMDPEVRLTAPLPEGRVEAGGMEEVGGFLTRFLSDWEDYRFEPGDLESVWPDRWLASGTQIGRGRTSGVDASSPVFLAIALRDDRIVRLDWFLGRDEALAALTP